MAKVSTKLKRTGPSSAQLLANSLAESKKSLSKHKSSAQALKVALDKGMNTSRDGNISINETNTTYNKAVDSIGVIEESSIKLNKFSNDMAAQNIATRQMKTKLLNVVQQFTKDSAATGKNIVDLQNKIKQHVNENSAEILGLIQKDRENNYDTLASVKLRKGINELSEKYNIPITRLTASVSAIVCGFLGFKLGKMI